MRIFVRLYKWILLSVFIQTLILSYVNFIFLNRKAQIVATDFSVSRFVTNSKFKTEIPENATDIKLSYDNAYAGYLMNGSIEIMDLTKKTTKTIKSQSGEITFYKWMPDRNILIYAVKQAKNNNRSIQLVTYDIASENEKTYPKISISSQTGGEVSQIELSPLTNVVYAMVKDGERAKIYRYDIMSYSSFIMYTSLDTVIKETSFEDNLIYQDEAKNIYFKNNTQYATKKLALEKKALLLNVDSEDKVFVGLLDNHNKIEKILYGKLTENIEQWNSKILDIPLSKNDIIISTEGKIFTKSDENSIMDLDSNKKINFTGIFIELNFGNIVSIDKNKLYLTSLK